MNAKMFIILMFSAFFSFFLPPGACAKGSALAVLSFDNPAYRETLKGFTETSGLAVTDYVMASDEKELSSSVTGAKAYDVIFAIGTKAYAAAKKTKLPVVFSMVFAEPSEGGAGVTLVIPAQMKIDKIKEFLPGKKKVGVIYTDESAAAFSQFAAAAKAGGYAIAEKKIPDADGFSDAFDGMGAIDCYLMLPDTKLYTSQTIKALFSASLSKKIPVIGLSSIYTKAGAYISLDCDYADIGSQSGEIASGLAGGGKGKVAYPRKVSVSMNSAISKSMGFDGIEAKADQSF
jgi:ABC-type uncharacterized transport system substrate-binding protein